jgi:hypothetical protein
MSGERVDILRVIDKTDLAHGVSVHRCGRGCRTPTPLLGPVSAFVLRWTRLRGIL